MERYGRRWIIIVGALTLLLLDMTFPLWAAQYQMKLVHVFEPGSVQALSTARFAELVRKETKGEVEIQLFPSGRFADQKLTSPLEVARQISQGAFEMGLGTTSSLANVHDKLGVLDLPFLFRDYRHVEAMTNGSVGEHLLSGLLRSNLRGLAYFDLGFGIIATKETEIRSPKDLEGLKIRTLEGAVPVALYEILGAKSVPAPVREVMNLARQGRIDGAHRFYGPYWDFAEYEVLKVINETNHSYAASVLLINEGVYNGLPKPYQRILKTAALRVAKLHRVKVRAREEEVRRMCREKGIKIVRLSPEERMAFELKAQLVWARFSPQFGKELIDRIKRLQ